MTDQSHDRNRDLDHPEDPTVELAASDEQRLAASDEQRLAASDEQRLAALLDNPVLWQDPDPGSADAIVAAIQAEAGDSLPGSSVDRPSILGDHPEPTPETSLEIGAPGSVASLDAARDRRAERANRRARWLQPALGAVAGAAVAVLVLGVLPQLQDDSSTPIGVELALEATDLAPEAAAEIKVIEGQLGTRIDLDVAGLEPAPPGTYYEAWLRQGPDVGVSAGTFHLRGGDGQVELWAGVSPSDYPLFTITIQEEAQEESSGQVVLRGILTSP